jgi:hypothetical protein
MSDMAFSATFTIKMPSVLSSDLKKLDTDLMPPNIIWISETTNETRVTTGVVLKLVEHVIWTT